MIFRSDITEDNATVCIRDKLRRRLLRRRLRSFFPLFGSHFDNFPVRIGVQARNKSRTRRRSVLREEAAGFEPNTASVTESFRPQRSRSPLRRLRHFTMQAFPHALCTNRVDLISPERQFDLLRLLDRRRRRTGLGVVLGTRRRYDLRRSRNEGRWTRSLASSAAAYSGGG